MNKDKWVDDILNTSKKTEVAKANPSLYENIKARLNETPVIQIIPAKWIYAAAAVAGLLLILNISVWKNISKNSDDSMEPSYRSEFSLTGNNTYSLNY